MKAKLLSRDTQRTFALVLEKGEEVASALLTFATENDLSGSHITAIGAFSKCVLGYFDRQLGDYKRIPINEQVELLSLIGNVAHTDEGKPKVHAHLVVAKSNGIAHGGHLLEAHVWPTFEAIITESPQHLQRKVDADTGLPLINVE